MPAGTHEVKQMNNSAASPTALNALPYPKAGVAWYATIVLALLYWLSILDRFIISLMVDPIKRDMGISDLQFGMLHGMAFAVTFSLFGLIAGALADRYSRRWIIFASVSIWSLATALCGAAAHYWQLLLARVGVGAGEAGLNPSATSMLSDMFPREKLTTAMAVYALGATLGSGTAFFVGGIIVDVVAQAETYTLPLLGDVRSWQAVFFIIGVPGIVLSLIVFTFPEPARRDRTEAVTSVPLLSGIAATYKKLLAFMGSQRAFFTHHYAAMGLASLVVAGCGIWYPAHMARHFQLSPTEIGLYLGPTMILGSFAGKLLFGSLADRLYKLGHRDALYRLYSLFMIIATPVGIATFMSDSVWAFLGGLFVFLVLVSPFPACNITALNLSTPNEMRGSGIAFFAGTAGLLAMAIGPILIAGLSDQIFGGNAIGLGMAATVAVCCPLGALLLRKGRKHLKQALEAMEGC